MYADLKRFFSPSFPSNPSSSLNMSDKIGFQAEESIELGKDEAYKRKALKLQGTQLFALAFSTLGVIYSDIGESSSSCFG
jgi:hypothetical protein